MLSWEWRLCYSFIILYLYKKLTQPVHPYPLWHPVYWLCTWGHCGLSPKAPGTVGSLVALPYAWIIHQHSGVQGLLIATILFFFAGWFVSERYVQQSGREDPKEVVVDEVVGMWLVSVAVLTMFYIVQYGYYFETVFFEPYKPYLTSKHQLILMANLVIGFLLFRLFDIWKPWPISVADKKIKGGFGIMLDDVLAAIYAIILYIVGSMMFLYFNPKTAAVIS